MSAGTCFNNSATAGATTTNCCTDATCTTGGPTRTRCDIPTHTCSCPAPPPGTFYVSPTGSNANSPYAGNGSAVCPYKTIANALTRLTAMPTTIILANGTAGAPNIYGSDFLGAGCTGGAPCDPRPIIIPAAFTSGLTIRGAGARDEVVLTTDASSVLLVRAPSVSFANLTIRPTMVGSTGTGGDGIVYDAPSSPPSNPSTVQNVTITGISNFPSTGTGAGIRLRNAANPTLGDGLIINGGTWAILVEQSASPAVTASAAAPTGLGGAMGTLAECVRVQDTGRIDIVSDAGTSTSLVLSNCRDAGAIVIDTTGNDTSTVVGVTINRDAGAPPFTGINVLQNGRLNARNVNVANPGLSGIVTANSAQVSLSAVSVTNTGATGVVLRGATVASITNLTATGNFGGGLRSEGTTMLTMTGTSNTSNNTGTGVLLQGGTVADITGLTSSNNISSVPTPAHGLRTEQTSSLTLNNSNCSSNQGTGVWVAGTSSASLNGVIASGNNAGDGLRCDSAGANTLRVRSSTFLQNSGHGVNITGVCAADLGSASSAGNNTFQKTATRNSGAGLCYLSTGTPGGATPYASTWSCNRSTAITPVCATGTPVVTSLGSCIIGGAIDVQGNSSVTTPPPQTCCSQ